MSESTKSDTATAVAANEEAEGQSQPSNTADPPSQEVPKNTKRYKIYAVKLASTKKAAVEKATVSKGIDKDELKKLVADSLGAHLGKLVDSITSSVEAKLSPSPKKKVAKKRPRVEKTAKPVLAKQVKLERFEPMPSTSSNLIANTPSEEVSVFVHPNSLRKGMPKRLYSKDDVQKAIEAIMHQGCSKNKAAAMFNVPKSTLGHKMRMVQELGYIPDVETLNKAPGPKPLYGSEAEDMLKNFMTALMERNFHCSEEVMRQSIVEISLELGTEEDPEKVKKPSVSWRHRFLDRHPEIRDMITENKSDNSEEAITAWYTNLWSRLQIMGQENLLTQPQRVFTLEEIALPLTEDKIYRKNECRWFYCANKEAVRHMCICFSAAGTVTPPFLTFPGSNKAFNVVQGVWATVAPLGWLKAETRFVHIDQLRKHFVSKRLLNPDDNEKKVLLFLDGHASAITYKIYKYCEDAGIIVWSLLPKFKTTRFPADPVVEAIQEVWPQIRKRHRPNPTTLTALQFSSMCKEALEKVSKSLAVMKRGFKDCGIVPFDMVRATGSYYPNTSADESALAGIEMETEEQGQQLQNNCQFVDERALLGGFSFFCSFLPPKKLKEFQKGKGSGKLHEIWRDWGKMVNDYNSGQGVSLEG